jgi:hypothetical protein
VETSNLTRYHDLHSWGVVGAGTPTALGSSTAKEKLDWNSGPARTSSCLIMEPLGTSNLTGRERLDSNIRENKQIVPSARVGGNNLTCLVEYYIYITVFPKELGKGVSVIKNTKLVADSYFRGKESIIAFQWVTICDSFAVYMYTLQLGSWSQKIKGPARAKQKLFKKRIHVLSKKLFQVTLICCSL